MMTDFLNVSISDRYESNNNIAKFCVFVAVLYHRMMITKKNTHTYFILCLDSYFLFPSLSILLSFLYYFYFYMLCPLIPFVPSSTMCTFIVVFIAVIHVSYVRASVAQPDLCWEVTTPRFESMRK